jgi:hypothetical protein
LFGFKVALCRAVGLAGNRWFSWFSGSGKITQGAQDNCFYRTGSQHCALDISTKCKVERDKVRQ